MNLIDRLGPDIFPTLRMKGHVLHRARAHLKVIERVLMEMYAQNCTHKTARDGLSCNISNKKDRV